MAVTEGLRSFEPRRSDENDSFTETTLSKLPHHTFGTALMYHRLKGQPTLRRLFKVRTHDTSPISLRS
ncbi:hypothetical protein TNCV_3002811 [Trichonephila clavipes]|nr:hypothetical protein TNCV_3002811 [Trichonephila clavipes]